jgi:DnaJ domain
MAAAGDPRDYYRVLGVERTASAEDIKSAFRQRAKQLHPDRGGVTGDRERFRRLLEAYETLRDPQRRLSYDAEGLATARCGDGSGPGSDLDQLADGPGPGGPRGVGMASVLRSGAREFAAKLAPRGPALLAVALVLTLGTAIVGWHRASERARAVADLTRQVDDLRNQPPPAAGAGEMPIVYASEFQFADDSGDLDAAARARLVALTDDLRRVIAGLPADNEWVVEVKGVIERAADGHGLLIDAWEVALLRVGVTTQYLVSHGIPAERVAVRFHAGARAAAPSRAHADAVVLSLLCCLAAADH